MRVVVVHSWARDPGAASVRADGSVDWRGARMVANDDDPAALGVARRLVDGSGGELIALTIGGDSSWALARGAGSDVAVANVSPLADDAATAAVIAAAVRRIGDVDVVVIGDAAEDHPGVAAALAGHLRWTALVGLDAASVSDGQLCASRHTGRKSEQITVGTPAVLAIAAAADVDRAPGMKEMLAARKRPVTTWTLAELGVVARDIESHGTRRPDIAPARIFEGSAAGTAGQLLRALRAEGVL